MDSTSASLLVRLQSAENDTAAWNRFVELYTPLIYFWARKSGLQANDASDLVQEVLATLVRKLPDFQLDPAKSFRGWLRTVTLNKWREIQRRNSINIVDATASQLGNIPAAGDEYWEQDYRRQLVARGMQLAKPLFTEKTWEALTVYIAGEQTASQVADHFQISVWTLYSAKSRLLAYLREELDGLLD